MEKIISSVPIDGVASRVTRKGFEYVPDLKENSQLHWEVCPDVLLDLPDNVIEDLTGVRFGRFVVIGLYCIKKMKNKTTGKTKGSKKCWVVRCDCGHFEIRQSKAIKNPKNNDDCCRNCRHKLFLKKRGGFEMDKFKLRQK